MSFRTTISSGLTPRFLLVLAISWLPLLATVALWPAPTGIVVLAALSMALVIAVTGCTMITRRVDRSLARLERATTKFAAGELGFRVYPPRLPQLQGLAQGLNAMGSELQYRVGALERLSSEQDAILRSMIEGVVTIDTDERVMRVNKAAISLLEIAADEWEGRSVPEVIHHAELQRFVRDAVRNEGVRSATISVWSASSQRFIEVSAAPLHNAAGFVTGTLLVLHDVTRLRRLEGVRRDFVANVSHELKTPITSIKGFVETLMDGAMNEPELLQKFLGIIARHADRLNAIFNDLLTLARLEAEGEDAHIDLSMSSIRDVVHGAVETCSSAAGIKQVSLTFEGAPDIKAAINPSLLEQAVVNLLDNAIKHTDAGGRVWAQVKVEQQGIVIAVSDTGCGIDKGHLPRLFERFYRVDQGRSRKMGGTGLGLAIVKHICQVHGGRVEATSTVGVGSCFSIYIPSGHTPTAN